MNEADTCRKLVRPKIETAGWEDGGPHFYSEQIHFTDGRIVTPGGKPKRLKKKIADFLLRYTRDITLGVVEAKSDKKPPGDGLQQAKDYAQILGLKFAYATNGTSILEYDFLTHEEKEVERFPTPDELWARYQIGMGLSTATANALLVPYYLSPKKEPRYYQRIAITRAVEAVIGGNRRNLLTLATGTGKTQVAFQICWKLWSAAWNAKNEPGRKPRVLFLADRNVLVDDPMAKDFAPFGDARHKIQGDAVKSREMYFAIYQAIAGDEQRSGLYKEYAPDFFDLVVIDECHRGSARDESNWRDVLEYFEPAYQIGMTATPLREDNRDTYDYFGNPLYTYSLKQGIEDGFLAPYRVHRVVTSFDAAGWRPNKGQKDKNQQLIPDGEYHTKDFERVVSLQARTDAIAKHITEHLKRTDRHAKTIVFCVDQEHADQMRRSLHNLNTDLVKQAEKTGETYVARVTADEKEIGRGFLSKFQDPEERYPVILTTSQLLTTGVDAPTCQNVALVRVVGSMSEFKQIIGRGTRVREDKGKLFFHILDYTGAATQKFADPEFDGEPVLATKEEIDDEGNTVETETTANNEMPDDASGQPQYDDDETKPRKYYVHGGLSDDELKELVAKTRGGDKLFDPTLRPGWKTWTIKGDLSRWTPPVQLEQRLCTARGIGGFLTGATSKGIVCAVMEAPKQPKLALAVRHRDSADRAIPSDILKTCNTILDELYPRVAVGDIHQVLAESLCGHVIEHVLEKAISRLAEVGSATEAAKAVAKHLAERESGQPAHDVPVKLYLEGVDQPIAHSDLQRKLVDLAISGTDELRKKLDFSLIDALSVLWAELFKWQHIHFPRGQVAECEAFRAETQSALRERIIAKAEGCDFDLEIYTLLESLVQPDDFNFRISLPGVVLRDDNKEKVNEYDVVSFVLRERDKVEVWIWGVTTEANITKKRTDDTAKIQKLKDLLGNRWDVDVRAVFNYVHVEKDKLVLEINGCQERR